ncbi:MAG: cytochrome c oxidase subunit II [Candidatus Limnocylindrales bacterium]
MPEPPHFRRILILWAALSIIATPIVVLVWAPDLPPGNGTNAASGQVTDNTVLLGVVTPIAALMIVYFAYALIVFRRRDEGPGEGIAIRGDRGIQTTWLAVTSVIVLFLATYGTVRLFDEGSGGGQGADPVSKPSGKVLPVQVIAQQWAFTYRFPTFGGVETPHLELPVDRNVALHVTSLDVIHSFWAHDLGVKADANPGVDNVAYVRPTEVRGFSIRCAELCGLFHGHMFDTGQVVSNSAFLAWIHREQAAFGPATGVLPKFRSHYNPAPHRRAG